MFPEQFLRKLERLALISRKAMVGKLQGERRSPKRGHSVEFADFRPYVSGDDIRRIDWNAYARLDRFFIKLFVEEEDITVHILIDNSRSMEWGEPSKLNYALQIAGAVGYIALAGLDRVTVATLSNQILTLNTYLKAIRGKKSALTLFKFLQTIHSEPMQGINYDPVSTLRAYANIRNNPGPLLLVSDLMNDGWQEGLNIITSQGYEITVLHILTPDEKNPDFAGDFKLVDSETLSQVEVTADFETLARYRKKIVDWQFNWRQFCGARGMQYITVETSVPLETLLFAWLRKQQVLR
jgi:hypothetical protein